MPRSRSPCYRYYALAFLTTRTQRRRRPLAEGFAREKVMNESERERRGIGVRVRKSGSGRRERRMGVGGGREQDEEKDDWYQKLEG